MNRAKRAKANRSAVLGFVPTKKVSALDKLLSNATEYGWVDAILDTIDPEDWDK